MSGGWYMAFTDQLLSGPYKVNIVEYLKANDWWL